MQKEILYLYFLKFKPCGLLRSYIHKITDNQRTGSVSSKLRNQRFAVFLEKLSVTPASRILDVGGTGQTWVDTGLEKNVTLLNLQQPKQKDLEKGFTCVEGNALNMDMFGEKHFDVVFSNSVIEHVGGKENQRRFAEEVRRVGRSYWVQTPNKYFPVEPHFLFPCFQFFPDPIKRKIGVLWPYSHYKRWNFSNERILQDLVDLRLLSKKELISLFKHGSVYEETFFGLTKSFAMYHRS